MCDEMLEANFIKLVLYNIKIIKFIKKRPKSFKSTKHLRKYLPLSVIAIYISLHIYLVGKLLLVIFLIKRLYTEV